MLVYVLGTSGREGATPVKLALAGAVLTALLDSLIERNPRVRRETLDEFRFWIVGSISAATSTSSLAVVPFIAVGMLIALAAGRWLNALGTWRRRGEGTRPAGRPARARSPASASCCSPARAVAAAGPITFVGLAVPHVARMLVGPDYRWIVPYSALLGAIVLLLARRRSAA